jgi:ribosome-associated protein
LGEKDQLLSLSYDAALDRKAIDIVVLDLRGITLIADYFLICSGRSTTHVQSISENISEVLEIQGHKYLRREGFREGRWILLDYGYLVIHVFQTEDRLFYNLERLWGDAKKLNIGLQHA